jgi:hypothetical protein
MEFKSQLVQAIELLGLCDKVIFIEEEQKVLLLTELRNKYVKENPRVLWIGLKTEPIILNDECDYDTDFVQSHIDNIFKNTDIFMLIEEDEDLLLSLNSSVVVNLLKECHLVEYSLFSKGFDKLFIENEHDQLLYIGSSLE